VKPAILLKSRTRKSMLMPYWFVNCQIMLRVPAAQEVDKLVLAHEAELEVRMQVLSDLQLHAGGSS
jgi:hypothetical protein